MNIKIYNKVQEMLKDSPNIMVNPHHLKIAIQNEFGVEVADRQVSINHLVSAIDEGVIENYFSKVWQPKHKKYKYSGLSMIDEINALNVNSVLDLGCGYNEFKGKINNLTGVDPYNDKADVKSSIIDYTPDTKYDVTICLGSINFGSTDKIRTELSHAVNLTAEGGILFFRANPGLQHIADEAKWIDFFEWTPAFILNAAEALNCMVVTIRQDANRLFFILKKREK